MSRTVDALVVGSGHNGLVAAAYLARAGWEVEVCEQAATPGGAIASEELTVPGYRHDTFSAWHPLFCGSAAWAELGDELRARGVDYVNYDGVVTATARADGSTVVAHRDPARTAAELDAGDATDGPGDGAAYLAQLAELGRRIGPVGELLGSELHSAHAAATVARLSRGLGVRGSWAFTAQALASARGWLTGTFAGGDVGALLAPWVLHTGMAPEDAGGGLALLALAGGLHEVGMPIVRGGAAGLVAGLCRLISDHGGRVRCEVPVRRIVVAGGRASAVIAGDEEIRVRRAVIAGTTPTQLYRSLLDGAGDAVPAAARAQARAFRYGRRSGMQIHLALREPPRWRDDALLGEAAIVHLSDGLDAVTRACAQAAGGALPARPTIVCGQPTVADPSRAPVGGAVLWIQLQEVPTRPSGDAAGEIDVGDGTWTDTLAGAYADRVIARLADQTENLPDAIVGRAVLSPADLEARNPNLVGGDIYAGACDLDQSWLWRPLPGYGSHATPVPGLYHCGASTHPGPGLNAASGRIVARMLLAPSRRRALRRRRAR